MKDTKNKVYGFWCRVEEEDSVDYYDAPLPQAQAFSGGAVPVVAESFISSDSEGYGAPAAPQGTMNSLKKIKISSGTTFHSNHLLTRNGT